MPLSRVVFEWRDGPRYRVISPYDMQHADDEYPEWEDWQSSETFLFAGLRQVAAGDSDKPTWWLLYGEAPATDTVTAWLADDRDVAVTRLEGLWIAEWVSLPQAVFIEINGRVIAEPARRPAYLPASPFPYDRSARNPRA